MQLSDAEPAGHGIGRSRGGLTTKIHHAVDGKGRPLAIVITGGANETTALCWNGYWPTSGFRAAGADGHGSDPTQCWQTRPSSCRVLRCKFR
jgi:hypothetical protein